MPGRGGDGGCTAAGGLRELGGARRRSHITAAADVRGGGAPVLPPRPARRPAPLQPRPAPAPARPAGPYRGAGSSVGSAGAAVSPGPAEGRRERGLERGTGPGSAHGAPRARPLWSAPFRAPFRARSPRVSAARARPRPQPDGDTSFPRPAENKLLPRNGSKQRSDGAAPARLAGPGRARVARPAAYSPFQGVRLWRFLSKVWERLAARRGHYSRGGLAGKRPPPKTLSAPPSHARPLPSSSPSQALCPMESPRPGRAGPCGGAPPGPGARAVPSPAAPPRR